MRIKFTKAREPSNNEKAFIRALEQHKIVSVDMLLIMTNESSQRTLRAFKEAYNNYKYIGYVPKGEIHQQGDAYILITPEHKDSDYYRRKAEYDFVCGIIARKNNERTLGKRQAKGQLQFKKLIKLSPDQLQEYANKLLEDIL